MAGARAGGGRLEEGPVKQKVSPVLAVAILVAAVGIGAGLLRLFLGVMVNPIDGNEREALRVLDSVATLEKLWRDGDADGNGKADWWTADWSGFYRVLAKNGKPVQMISGAVASADMFPQPAGPGMSALLPKSAHAGYFFRALSVEGGYAFVAFPAEPGISANRVFITREDGRIWESARCGPPTSWPAWNDETMKERGWTLVKLAP